MPIDLDRASVEPLYRQVATSLRRAIDDGRLRPGQRVPSVRALAAQLDVSRLTVATAYDQLVAEGYLTGRIGFGTVVAADPPEPDRREMPFGPRPAGPSARPARLPSLRTLPPLPGGRDRGRGLSDSGTPRFDLRSSAAAGWSGGTADGGLAVGATLERLLREEFRRVAERGGGGEIPDPAGDARLRGVIAGHLRATRAARCDPAQVVVLSGAVLGATVIGRLWVGAGRRVAVEDPGDPGLRRALLASGGEAVAVPVDGQGWRADLLPADVQVALVAPTVQVPTGSMLPLARRLRTLAWASAGGALVVEDGRFDDHLLRSAPLPSLQGLDTDGRVILIGSFESLLHGGIRTAFAVVPPALVEPFVSELATIDPGASPVQQRALGRFVADGLMDRHLGRVRRSLVDRQDAVLGAVQRDLGWLVSVRPATGGTRLIASIEDPAWSAGEVARVAAAAGVALEPLAAARVVPASDRELVIDYGRHEPLELQAAIRVLGKALRAHHRAGQSGRATLSTIGAGAGA